MKWRAQIRRAIHEQPRLLPRGGGITILCALFVLPLPMAIAQDTAVDEQASVRAAALAYWDAYLSGDKDAYSAIITGRNALTIEQAMALLEWQAAGRSLHEAIQEKLGADGEALAKEYGLSHPDTVRDRVLKAEITIDGDTARLVREERSGYTRWRFKKIDGRWKHDITDEGNSDEVTARNIDSLARVTRARSAVAEEILAGTIKSVSDARLALQRKSMPPQSTTASTTRPATRRATTSRAGAGSNQRGIP